VPRSVSLIQPSRRAACAWLVMAMLAVGTAAMAAPRQAEPAAPAPAREATAPVAEAAGQEPGSHEASGHEATESTSLMPTIAKVVNFSVLVGFLVYFLRAPIVEYLSSRSTTIRKDLSDAKALRTSAEEQLASVRARLAELPAELKALEARGRDELARERDRLKVATAQERERLLERARREIDLQSRVAHRELVEHVADLAVSLARTRIERSMTADDQTRLVERYTAEVRQ
jgi:F-type H+-transporting ATPase subunit b